MLNRFFTVLILSLSSFFLVGPSHSATQKTELIEQNWPFNGIFGRFDKSSLQRGFQVYREVCAGCHGIRHIAYRDLIDLGYTSDEIKSIATEYEVIDGPNDDGEMFTRFARPSDKFVGPYLNDKEARVANGGAYPPDLSLMVKARVGGADYLYSLLNGYKEYPENFEWRKKNVLQHHLEERGSCCPKAAAPHDDASRRSLARGGRRSGEDPSARTRSAGSISGAPGRNRFPHTGEKT